MNSFSHNSYSLGRILPNMDAIVVLDDGRLVNYGSYEEVEMESANLIEQAEHDMESSAQLERQQDDSELGSEGETSGTVNESGATSSNVLNLQRSNGSWAVYSYYARAAGKLSLLLLAFFTLVSSITTNYMSRLLSIPFIIA